jgi:hypothetical protein
MRRVLKVSLASALAAAAVSAMALPTAANAQYPQGQQSRPGQSPGQREQDDGSTSDRPRAPRITVAPKARRRLRVGLHGELPKDGARRRARRRAEHAVALHEFCDAVVERPLRFEASVAECAGNDLGAAIMSIEPKLGDDDAVRPKHVVPL